MRELLLKRRSSQPCVAANEGRAGGLRRALVIGWAWSCLLSLAPTSVVANDAIVKSEFIYESAPFPSCHASTIVETDDGLVAAWFGGTHERHPDVCIWVSRHLDGKWTAPTQVADGIRGEGTRYPTWNPVLFQPNPDQLWLFFKIGPTPRDWWGELITSSDNGATWSSPEALPKGFLGPIRCKPLALPTGRMLLPTSTEDDGWRVHFEMTNLERSMWCRTKALNDPAEVRAIQPTVLDYGDGRLQALVRTRRSGIYQTWSNDYGETWSPLASTDLPNPSAGIDGVTLADGRQLLVYNHSSESRSPLNVAISSDGENWMAALELENDPDAQDGFSYPAVIQSHDGMVHITYTWKRKRIRWIVIDPDRLSLKPMPGGQWPKSS